MAKKAKTGALRLYKSYMFRDKDPVIDALRTAVSDSGMSYTEIQAESGVTVGTQRSWFTGKTRKPQFATTAAVGTALGKKGVMFNKGKPYLV